MADVTVGKKLIDDLTLAYIAGFLDGDGAISAVIEPHAEKKYKFRVRISLDFYQHKDNIGVLRYIRDVFGEGSLGKSIRDTHKLALRSQESLRRILPLLYRFTKIKRRQIEIAIKILSKQIKTRQDLLYAARLADKLSSHNVRSKSRRRNYARIID